jgi:phage-related protein
MNKIKSLHFVGSSLDDLRNFPDEARRAAGFELHAVQSGLEPSDWRPMPIVGSGVREIRIHILGEWRVMYVAKFQNSVYVLHAFKKKTRRTNQQDIDLARKRYKQIGE